MVPKFKCYLIIIGCFQVIFSGTSKQGEAYEYFLKGEYEILQNNFRQAEKHYTKALSLSPDSPTILRSLVDLKSYQGEYEDAIQYLEKILELEPDNKDSGLDLYQLHVQAGNLIKAERVLDTLLIHFPGDQDILFARANTQYSEQDWSNLLKTYQSIYVGEPTQTNILIKIYEIGIATGNIELVQEILWELKVISDDPVILEILIEISSTTGEYPEAIELTQELIEKYGSTDDLNISLGALHLRAEHFEEVIAILQPIYETGNYSIDILRMLLIVYSTLGRVEEEINISQTLLNEYPDLSIGYEALSFAYLQSGFNEKAIEILLRALPKFPDEVNFPYTLATIFNNSGDFRKAEKYYHDSLAIQPDLVSVKHALAIMYEDMQDITRSDSLFLHMIQQDENDAVGHNDYAYILSEREQSSVDDLNFALELAENAISIEPDNAAFLDTIGWIYFKLGTYRKAEEFIEKSLSINDNNPVILEHLGDIYLKLNKSAEAVNIYEKVLQIDSGNQLIKDKINKINE